MKNLLSLLAGIILLTSFTGCNKEEYSIDTKSFSLLVNDKMQTKLKVNDKENQPLTSGYAYSEFLNTNYGILKDFSLTSSTKSAVQTALGEAEKHMIKGTSHDNGLAIDKTVFFTTYKNYPDLISVHVLYKNNGNNSVQVTNWTNSSYTVLPADTLIWSFQGATYSTRPDWILPVTPGYSRGNYLGQNSTDYGGGIPIIDLWRRDKGIAIGILETKPTLVSLPVEMKTAESGVEISIKKNTDITLSRGEILETEETFIYLHNGDCYSTLETFTRAMQEMGIEFPDSEPSAYEPVWCAWGYERDFTLDEVIGTLPKVKELGITWAVLDDGFQITEGDWNVNQQKFPQGEKQMKDLVKKIHNYGLKAKLWYAPLAIDLRSELYEKDPDLLLINKQQSPQYITWWDCFMMAPQYKGTIDHTLETIDMFMNDWGFDGLKLDGQHLNSVPCDHSWTRPPEYPMQSVESIPLFFDTIYQTARNIKPNAVVEICPCGCCCNYFIMPHMNQAVSSDPTSSWQIRLKGKVYHALMPNTAYYGDHVELSDNGNDFASSFGIGAVLGTKFTWPANNPTASGDFLLTPEKEENWKFWFNLYENMRLSQGKYLGELYDIGYDKPEAHVIEKDNILHYAFYDKNWNGPLVFRGLKEKQYHIIDYINNKNLGTLTGPEGSLEASFSGSLLVKAVPVE